MATVFFSLHDFSASWSLHGDCFLSTDHFFGFMTASWQRFSYRFTTFRLHEAFMVTVFLALPPFSASSLPHGDRFLLAPRLFGFMKLSWRLFSSRFTTFRVHGAFMATVSQRCSHFGLHDLHKKTG
ncbi:hypothetical protein [Cytobacillus oceanisediminis]|uniref:hypothetical protein n=1 Tax=Cytobacillus oceanisediminis TaxID=665099 RepID=UPI0012F934F7|nr:hypothetical protein [Cytobacillus oceanisediminis]USK42508.1 hypothetical protein LIT27_17965 [Cytobacillus oceanisediminis]